jgi:thiamine pyrophosphate-dependent acetolactate synthase large subunit-like protein
MVALSMADGYARYTRKPQCVIVHVDVGTQGLGAAVHNASCGRAPVLIFAGLSPFTIEGEMRGSRTEYIHWIQDVPDQKQIVGQYCRYSAEIKTGKNVKQMVNRALQFACSDPSGPVYLCGAREVMEEDLDPYTLQQAHWNPVEPTGLSENSIKTIADALAGAKEPLLITGYSGRNHAAVPALVKLTETIKGLRVLDTGGSDMCFPADHRASLGLRYGIDASITTADVILVIDCDVPWINTLCHPSPSAKVFHIDVDPLKSQMPVFYLAAVARYRADSYTAISQLNHYLTTSPIAAQLKNQEYEARWAKLEEDHQKRISSVISSAKPKEDGTFGTGYLCHLLRATVPEDTIFAIEAVTGTGFVADNIRPTLPGSWINCGGGGLGWSGGGALGIKLATVAEDGNGGKFVCQIVGDGTFLFSVPGSVYWIAQRYGIPILTIVLNNKGIVPHSHGLFLPILENPRTMLTLPRMERAEEIVAPRSPRRLGFQGVEQRVEHRIQPHAGLCGHCQGCRWW